MENPALWRNGGGGSAPWLTRITEPPVLENLGEARLDCADGAAWLARLEAAGQ